MDLICYGCMVGFHEECIKPKPLESAGPEYYTCCCWATEAAERLMTGSPSIDVGIFKETDIPSEERKRTPKDAEEVRDQTSTGRKRAVNAIAEWGRGVDGSLCEWAYLRNAGGGAVPIVGCSGTIIREVKQTEKVEDNESPRHIHHGPDKSTLNNNPENLHAICASCHGRWHTLNDPQYAKDRPDFGRPHLPIDGDVLPHDPRTKANDKEVEFSNKFWSLTASQRKVIQFRLMLETLGSLDEQLTGP